MTPQHLLLSEFLMKFDEKTKGMHKSRKLIIDTVFGREDNTQRVFGYEKETETKEKPKPKKPNPKKPKQKKK